MDKCPKCGYDPAAQRTMWTVPDLMLRFKVKRQVIERLLVQYADRLPGIQRAGNTRMFPLAIEGQIGAILSEEARIGSR